MQLADVSLDARLLDCHHEETCMGGGTMPQPLVLECDYNKNVCFDTYVASLSH